MDEPAALIDFVLDRLGEGGENLGLKVAHDRPLPHQGIVVCAGESGRPLTEAHGHALKIWPCPWRGREADLVALRLLASINSHHPDYREEWRP